MGQVFDANRSLGQLHGRQKWSPTAHHWIHYGNALLEGEKDRQAQTQTEGSSGVVEGPSLKVKRKKLKGKRAVVRWLKFFRYKKKRDYQRMTDEEKLLYKLNKAQKKEQRLLDSLKKIEPNDSSETKHDPEILTPEEHFYFLKMGLKSKNYVPVGRRGIYQGVILNMHLHWKKHQTLQVIVKTFTPEEVKEIAVELARLSGGIVLDIHEENTIIMYRGKNYAQPPTEIMSPQITLPRKKALDKSKYRDALRSVRRYIPRVEQELELLRARIRNNEDNNNPNQTVGNPPSISSAERSTEKLRAMIMAEDGKNDPLSDDEMVSDSEDLSDMFESELESEEEEAVRPLYLHTFDKFPSLNKQPGDFEEQLKNISSEFTRPGLSGEDKGTPDFDEVDQIFLRAATLLKRKR
ncbi:hypothetical protein V2J09_017328 [Rumex salicifolius]